VLAPAGMPLKAGEGIIGLASAEVRVDPLAEWKQIYRELWRIDRSYFYDANLHGLDAVAMEKQYEPYVETLASRDD
jgi:tricorn protease